MKKFLIILALLLTSMAMLLPGAEAKRLGGGGSFGKQSSTYSRQATPAAPAAPLASPQSTMPRPASPWKGMLGGALLGLGLGALMSHFGMGGMFGNLLLIALVVFAALALVRLLSRKSQAQTSYQNDYTSNGPHLQTIYPASAQSFQGTPAIGSGLSGRAPGSGTNDAAHAPWGIPEGFDVPGFVRNGKSYFIRLQAAWDRADINDIREFTTPEMFGELRLQIQERGATPNVTDVVRIDGELLGIETLAHDYLATLKFTGLIKEAPDASAEPFSEIWNLSKPIAGTSGWVLAGIEQV